MKQKIETIIEYNAFFSSVILAIFGLGIMISGTVGFFPLETNTVANILQIMMVYWFVSLIAFIFFTSDTGHSFKEIGYRFRGK